MIYLLDDNQNNQRERLGVSYVDEGVFNGYLTSIEKIQKQEQISNILHLAFLKDAKCILLHATMEDYDEEKKSFISGSLSNVINIKENIAQEGDLIPLVVFSNGTDGFVYFRDKYPNYISAINKNLFYEHLWDFVNHYKQTGEIELRILAWGKNYQAKEISKYANILLETLAFRDGADLLKANDSEIQLKMKAFIEMVFPDVNCSDFLKNLDDNPIPVQDFRERINLIVESFYEYGKNIYPWS